MKPPRRRPFVLLALGLLAVALAFAACRPKITAPSEPPLAVRLGDDAFRLQDYEAAIEDYGVYLDSVERGEYTPLAFYQTALCWYRLERYEQTLDVLNELERRYDGEHWVQADALRGDAQYKLGRRSAALLAWDEGWSVAQPNERPELRRRIVTVLREMDEAELAETRAIVDNPDVAALVEHHLAIAQQEDRGPGLPPVQGSRVASASVPAKGGSLPPGESPARTSTATVTTEDEVTGASQAEAETAAPAPVGPSAAEIAERADAVSADADEVARLSDELDETGSDVFEATEDTKQAESEIRAVDESTATYAPLLRVEIPEPPFVDRPVPEPKKIIRVAPPVAEQPAAAEPDLVVVGQRATVTEETLEEETVEIDEVDIVSGPPVGLERVDAVSAASVGSTETEPVAPASGPDVKVACVLPLTGANRAAGENLLRSIRLVFGAGSDEIVFRDSGSDPEAARRLVGELSADSTILIAIAPAGTGDARSIAGSAERAAVPLLLVSPTTVPKSTYVLPVMAQTGRGAETFAAEYRARYDASPDILGSKAYSAALLARRALQIAPVPRDELVSRLAVLPPPSAAADVSRATENEASQPPAGAG